MLNQVTVDGTVYTIIKQIGHGKGGYSYLAKSDFGFVVVKQIHHEPCDYYSFGNKIESEINDYLKLVSIGIKIPRMIAFDKDQEIIVKEYIDGPTIFEMVRDDINIDNYIIIVKMMAEQAKKAGINIDYFPTNFVTKDGELYYIDYECNSYMDEWNFDNWGIKYWSKTDEFIAYQNSLPK